MARQSEAPLDGRGGAGTHHATTDASIVPQRRILETHYLRYVDDDRLRILIDHSAHFDAEAIAAGVDLDSDWLAGERAWADAAREVLTDRAKRGHRYEPGRMQVSRELLDEIRQRIDLPALIGQTITLHRSGRVQQGNCPFHESKSRRSFTVYPDNRFWCFGCHAHGDAIDWLMATEQLSFREAVKRAAALAGLVRA